MNALGEVLGRRMGVVLVRRYEIGGGGQEVEKRRKREDLKTETEEETRK